MWWHRSADPRLYLIPSFLAIAVAAFYARTLPSPIGFWAGMYANYWQVWIALAVAMLISVIGCYRCRLPRVFVLIAASATVAVIISLTLKWGIPIGLRDPWTHLYFVKTRQLSFKQNPYPVFHVLVATVSVATGLSPPISLRAVPLLSAVFGVLAIALSINRLGLSKVGWQLALLASIPAVFADFLSRPFTIAIPFLAIFYWLFTAQILPIKRRALAILFLTVLAWTHPVVLFAALCIVVSTIAIDIMWIYLPIQRFVSDRPLQSQGVNIFVIFIVIMLVTQIFLVTSVGRTILSQAFVATSADITESATRAESSGMLMRILPNFFEFLRRSSFAIFLGIGAILALWHDHLSDQERHNRTPIALIAVVATGLLSGGFVFISLSSSINFGVARILNIAPLLLVPAFARGIRSPAAPHVILAICVILSGGAIAFESPFTGGTQYGPAVQEKPAVEWIGVYGDEPSIVGSGSTAWIAQATVGDQANQNWTEDWSAQYTYFNRGERYSWQVTDRPPDALYVSSSASRARATDQRHGTPLEDLRQFRQQSHQVYDNGSGGTQIYQRSSAIS